MRDEFPKIIFRQMRFNDDIRKLNVQPKLRDSSPQFVVVGEVIRDGFEAADFIKCRAAHRQRRA